MADGGDDDPIVVMQRRLDAQAARLREQEEVGPVKPPVFSGKLGESFDDFLEQFEMWADAKGYEADRRRRILPMYLGYGMPMETFRNLTQDQKDDYTQLKDALTAALRTDQNAQFKIRQMYGRVQGPTETCTGFGEALRKMAKAAYPGADNAAQRESTLRNLFLKGLRLDLQPAFWLETPNTFSSCLLHSQTV